MRKKQVLRSKIFDNPPYSILHWFNSPIQRVYHQRVNIPHHDGQHPLSMATTSLQQARHFNAPEVNIVLPTINTLCAMPSVSQLSSTPTNFSQLNLRNTDSDNADYSKCNDISICSPVVGVGNIHIKKCSFPRNSFHLPPDVAFQVHCLSVISQHKGNDLNMFNQVMQCVSGHALHRNVDFRTIHVMSRDQLL
jgi:hypothetical protein